MTEAAHKTIELEKMKDGEGLTCNCGVFGGGGHSINEFITIKSLSEAAKRVAAVVWYI